MSQPTLHRPPIFTGKKTYEPDFKEPPKPKKPKKGKGK